MPAVPTVPTVSREEHAGANLGGLHCYHSNPISSHGLQQLPLAVAVVEIRQDTDLIR